MQRSKDEDLVFGSGGRTDERVSGAGGGDQSLGGESDQSIDIKGGDV